jgi:hypothetical protein
MKHFASTTMLLLFTIITATGFSQQAATTKPKLFAAFPEVIDCSQPELARIFTLAQGQQATVAIAGNFAFSGTVTGNVMKLSNLQTVVIKSPAFSNAIFHVSKRTNADNSVIYVGRIINEAFADGYELKRTATGSYQLQKIETERVMPDCGMQ